MTTAQIVIITVLSILAFTSFAGSMLTKNENSKEGLSMLWALTTAAIIALLISVVIEMNLLRKQVEGKCPEYEKIDNVYKLKES